VSEVVRDALRAFVDGPSSWDPPRSLGIEDSRRAARGKDLSDLPNDAYGRGPA
jgi:hypothetical protein